MKKTLFTTVVIAAIAITAAFIGCKKNSGLVFVDYEYAEKNGIVVTNFVDNPIVATIRYDYSRIPDFSPKNIEVTLVRTVIPLDVWTRPNADLSAYTKQQIELQKKLMLLSSVDDVPIAKLKPRKASIKESTPGCLKIYCADDIGAYQIKYSK